MREYYTVYDQTPTNENDFEFNQMGFGLLNKETLYTPPEVIIVDPKDTPDSKIDGNTREDGQDEALKIVMISFLVFIAVVACGICIYWNKNQKTGISNIVQDRPRGTKSMDEVILLDQNAHNGSSNQSIDDLD